MKLTPILVAIVTTSAFGLAAAQEATPYEHVKFESTKTRAEVRAEVQAARAAGLLSGGEVAIFADQASGEPMTRAQVQAEVREAQRLGLLSGGELSAVFTPAQIELIRSAGLRAVAARTASTR